ncbi:hect type ubiquitin [Cyclospora cayetanensis]|uniref:Hect type ubiquitin n=1 Tax=Cyclospora cayetanensis TaxID=88456 RepID=A0A1D3CQV5_9EIME|nr:hect type ubiquitin [Cyclospora cayetanensis]
MLSKYEGVALLRTREGDKDHALELRRLTADTTASVLDTDGHVIAELLLRGAAEQEAPESHQPSSRSNLQRAPHADTRPSRDPLEAPSAAENFAGDAGRAACALPNEELLEAITSLAIAAEEGLHAEDAEACAGATDTPEEREAGIRAAPAIGQLESLSAGRVASLLVLQLRTMALSAVSELLQNRQVAAFLLRQRRLLESLQLVCLRPIAVPNFDGLEELRALSLRLCQLLRDRLEGSLAIESRLLLREQAATAFPYTPFTGLPFLLPSAWERRTAEGLVCPPEDWQVLLQRRTPLHYQQPSRLHARVDEASATRDPAAFACKCKRSLRLTEPSPLRSLPITLNRSQAPSAVCPPLAIGLHVDGCVLKPADCSLGSAYLYCSSGLLLHGETASTAHAGSTAPFGYGDTVGILLNAKQGLISVTKNGILQSVVSVPPGKDCTHQDLSSNTTVVAFRGVKKGCFRPAVWTAAEPGAEGAKLRLQANFGKSPFLYSFASSLDSVALQQLFAEFGLSFIRANEALQEPHTSSSRGSDNEGWIRSASRAADAARAYPNASAGSCVAGASAGGSPPSQPLQTTRQGPLGGVSSDQMAASVTALSEEALQRRAAAEALRDMMGSGLFPLGLCVSALRLQGDDMQAAADWLITSGLAELDAMQTRFLEEADAQENAQEEQQQDQQQAQQQEQQQQQQEGEDAELGAQARSSDKNATSRRTSGEGNNTACAEDVLSGDEEPPLPPLYAIMQDASEKIAEELLAFSTSCDDSNTSNTSNSNTRNSNTSNTSNSTSSSGNTSNTSNSSLSDEFAAAVLRSSRWYDDLLYAALQPPRGGFLGGVSVGDCGGNWHRQVLLPSGASSEMQPLSAKDLRPGLLVRIHPDAAVLLHGLALLPEAALDAAAAAETPTTAHIGEEAESFAPLSALQVAACGESERRISSSPNAASDRRASQALLAFPPSSATDRAKRAGFRLVTPGVIEGLVHSASGDLLLLEGLAGRCGFVWQVEGLEELQIAAGNSRKGCSSRQWGGEPSAVLEIVDEDTGTRRLVRLPQTVLCKAGSLWRPLHGLDALLGYPPVEALLTLLEKLERAVACLQVRQAVRRLLQSAEGPSLSLDVLGGGGLSAFLKLLQLSYSELGPPCFGGGASSGGNADLELLRSLAREFGGCSHRSSDTAAPPPFLCVILPLARLRSLHFDASAYPRRQSKHPYGHHQESLASVSFLPCRRLLLFIDPRTDLSGSEEGCSLTLSSDEGNDTAVFSIKHPGRRRLCPYPLTSLLAPHQSAVLAATA